MGLVELMNLTFALSVAQKWGANVKFAPLAPGAAMVSRTGLACDVDTPADLDAVLAAGWRYL